MLIIVTLSGLPFTIATFIVVAFNIFACRAFNTVVFNLLVLHFTAFGNIGIPSIYLRRFEPKMPEVAKKNPQQERDTAAIKVDVHSFSTQWFCIILVS